MKYLAQRNRLRALEAQLAPKGTRIVITGGLPSDFAPAKPSPPGGDLKHQHAAFARPAHTQNAPGAVSNKTRVRAS